MWNFFCDPHGYHSYLLIHFSNFIIRVGPSLLDLFQQPCAIYIYTYGMTICFSFSSNTVINAIESTGKLYLLWGASPSGWAIVVVQFLSVIRKFHRQFIRHLLSYSFKLTKYIFLHGIKLLINNTTCFMCPINWKQYMHWQQKNTMSEGRELAEHKP